MRRRGKSYGNTFTRVVPKKLRKDKMPEPLVDWAPIRCVLSSSGLVANRSCYHQADNYEQYQTDQWKVASHERTATCRRRLRFGCLRRCSRGCSFGDQQRRLCCCSLHRCRRRGACTLFLRRNRLLLGRGRHRYLRNGRGRRHDWGCRHCTRHTPLLGHQRDRNLHDFCCRDHHSFFQTKRVNHLPIHVELLILGDLERLIRSVFQRQYHFVRCIDIPNLSFHRLDGGNELRRSCRGNRALQLHAWLQVVNS